MHSLIGWLLAAAALVAGWAAYGWKGLVLAITLITFWLLLQFNRALRVMKNAAGAPVGRVDSAVMMHAGLRKGMTLMQIVANARSLGRKVAAAPETWTWSDAGGATVTLVFAGGRLSSWELRRPEPGADGR